MFDHGEALVRAVFGALPDGRYVEQGAMDNNGIDDELVPFEVAVEVRGGDVVVDFMGISTYGKGKTSSGEVKVTKDLDISLEGADVLVVEDIVDSGITLNYLMHVLQQRKQHHRRGGQSRARSQRRCHRELPL